MSKLTIYTVVASAIILAAGPLNAGQVTAADEMGPKMVEMQKQMEAIQQTQDPEKRQELMQKHMQSMQDGMKAMRGMNCGMMTGMKGHGHTNSKMMKDTPMSGEMMEQRMEMMDKRMEMMQSMMEQMLEHQSQQMDMPKQ